MSFRVESNGGAGYLQYAQNCGGKGVSPQKPQVNMDSNPTPESSAAEIYLKYVSNCRGTTTGSKAPFSESTKPPRKDRGKY